MTFAVLVLAGLLLLNAVFAMSELAMMTSRQSRLQHAAHRGSRGAATALGLAREPTRFLSTVQVGITLIGIFAGAFGETAFSDPLREWLRGYPSVAPWADAIALTAVVLLITYFSLVFGELVPKRIALAHPEAIASLIAPPLQFLSVVAALPIRLLSASTDAVLRLLRIRQRTTDDVSEEDVKSLVARAASTGVFDPEEHALFQRAFRIGDLKAKSLMVPRADVVWIDESMELDDVRVLLGTSPYSHFPVCRGSFDELVGVVHIKDLIAYGLLAGREFKVASVAQQPLYVPEMSPALKLLELFQAKRTHIAFVVDEYGALQGIVTLNDVVSALVGDVSRQGEDRPPQATRRADGSWIVDARMPLHDLMPTLGLVVRDDDEELSAAATVAGFVMARIGRIPKTGETVEWNGFRFEVIDMDGQRVDAVLVVPPAAQRPDQ
jgi:putative hemolysin